jgi:hypothetical protein
MALKAASNRIRGQTHPLVELGRHVGINRVSRSHIPSDGMGIVRKSVLVELVFAIVSDQGQSSVAGAEGIVDNGLEDPPIDLSTHFDLILALQESMDDLRTAWILDWLFGKRNPPKLLAARKSARVPAAVLLLKDGLMTFGATALTHKRGRLGLEGMRFAKGTGTAENRLIGGDSLLEITSGKEPTDFRIVDGAGPSAQLGACLSGFSELEKETCLFHADLVDIVMIDVISPVDVVQHRLVGLGGAGWVGLSDPYPT